MTMQDQCLYTGLANLLIFLSLCHQVACENCLIPGKTYDYNAGLYYQAAAILKVSKKYRVFIKYCFFP